MEISSRCGAEVAAVGGPAAGVDEEGASAAVSTDARDAGEGGASGLPL